MNQLRQPASRVSRRTVRVAQALGLALVLAGLGCATPSTVDTRRQERATAYAALPAEHRTAADKGQLKVGMSEDAVYIAWGKPAQILQKGDASGESTSWLYHATTSDTYLNWRYQTMIRSDGSTFLDRTLDRDLEVREYVSAELTFADGRLKSWRTLPRPASRTVVGSPIP